MKSYSVRNYTTVCLLLCCLLCPSVAWRDGARNESCYNHSIVHGSRTRTETCSEGDCPYSLIIREVLDLQTLQSVNGSEADSIDCGERIYSIELVNSLNDPEGYLIQARSGTEDTSEIIGTFLDQSEVSERDSSIPLNFRVLQCQRSMNNEDQQLYQNSATQPNAVNKADRLVMYWMSPNCSEYRQETIVFWFTVVLQRSVVYETSKWTTLRYNDIVETTTEQEMTTTMSASTTTENDLTATTGSSGTSGPGTHETNRTRIIGIAVAISGGVLLIFIGVLIITISLAVPRRKKASKQKFSTSAKSAYGVVVNAQQYETNDYVVTMKDVQAEPNEYEVPIANL